MQIENSFTFFKSVAILRFVKIKEINEKVNYIFLGFIIQTLKASDEIFQSSNSCAFNDLCKLKNKLWMAPKIQTCI